MTMYERARLHEFGIRRRRQRLELAQLGKTWDDPDVRRIEEHDQHMQNVQDRLLHKIIEFSNRRNRAAMEQEHGEEGENEGGTLSRARRKNRGDRDELQPIITEEELQEMDPETREDFLRKKKRLENALMLYDEGFQQYWRENVENVRKPRGFVRDYWRELLVMSVAAFIVYQIYVHLIILERNPQIKKIYMHEQKMKRNDREDLWKAIVSERRARQFSNRQQIDNINNT